MSDELLRSVSLDLGLEDWIPLPEAVAAPEVRTAVGDTDVAAAVGAMLARLVASGEVKLFRGRWDDDEPGEVGTEDGLRLLDDPRWFGFRLDDPAEERLYYANVENIRSDMD